MARVRSRSRVLAQPVRDGILERQMLGLSAGQISIKLPDAGPLLEVRLPVTGLPERARRIRGEEDEELSLKGPQSLDKVIGQCIGGTVDNEMGTSCLKPDATTAESFQKSAGRHSTILRLSRPSAVSGEGGGGLYPSVCAAAVQPLTCGSSPGQGGGELYPSGSTATVQPASLSSCSPRVARRRSGCGRMSRSAGSGSAITYRAGRPLAVSSLRMYPRFSAVWHRREAADLSSFKVSATCCTVLEPSGWAISVTA